MRHFSRWRLFCRCYRILQLGNLIWGFFSRYVLVRHLPQKWLTLLQSKNDIVHVGTPPFSNKCSASPSHTRRLTVPSRFGSGRTDCTSRFCIRRSQSPPSVRSACLPRSSRRYYKNTICLPAPKWGKCTVAQATQILFSHEYSTPCDAMGSQRLTKCKPSLGCASGTHALSMRAPAPDK